MSPRLVLDAAAFDLLESPNGLGQWAVIESMMKRRNDVWCAAVTLAEVCRGTARTRKVDAALNRAKGGRRIRVRDTDREFAKLVGAILHRTDSGSDRLGDAHVVAVCADTANAIVLTSDPTDITELATALPGVRIVVRDPRRL